ncbi:MAG: ATP synthase F1 subunit gamma [Rickettsia sp.]|nr:ATP synthase F1 subunit gamma [Rickettsia sp.]
MSSLKFFRNKIKSTKSTQRITKSMELVAGTKLRKIEKIAKNEDIKSQILFEEMSQIVHSFSMTEKQKKHIFCLLEHFLDLKMLQKLPRLLVAFTSERGLCGNFNQVIMKNFVSDIKFLEENGKDFFIIILGKKGYEILEKKYDSKILKILHIDKNNDYFVDKIISDCILRMIFSKKISNVTLYFYQFKNTLVQNFTKKDLLQFLFERKEEKHSDQSRKNMNITKYEGSAIFKNLLEQYIFNIVRYSYIQNIASEEAIRRLVMENASNNAGDILDSLYLKMNKKRQAIITTELTEIISGLNALE